MANVNVIVLRRFSVRGVMRHPGDVVKLGEIQAQAKVQAGKAKLASGPPKWKVLLVKPWKKYPAKRVLDLDPDTAKVLIEEAIAVRWSPKGRIHPPRTIHKPTHRKDLPGPPENKGDPGGETDLAESNTPPSETDTTEQPLPFEDFEALVESDFGDARKYAKRFGVTDRSKKGLRRDYKAMLERRANNSEDDQ